MEITPEERLVDRALESWATVYDALYIALALDGGRPLLTLDEKQREIAEKYGVARLHATASFNLGGEARLRRVRLHGSGRTAARLREPVLLR